MSESAFVEPEGGYGRIWEKTYQGSLVGAGPEVFCVWPYVIANMRRHPHFGAAVMLNPKLLAGIFGCDEEFVKTGIEKLCEEDPESKNGLDANGRRLERHGNSFMYRVVNGSAYMALRDKEKRLDQNRKAQAKYQEKKKKAGTKSAAQVRAENDNRQNRYNAAKTEEDREEIAAEGIPEIRVDEGPELEEEQPPFEP